MSFQSSRRVTRRAMLYGAAAFGAAGILPAHAAATFSGASAIQTLINERVAARQLPGAIVWKGEGTARPEFVAGGTLDFESRAPVDENTIFRLASMTKPIAGMAAMLLIGEGRLRLDQSIADFIPAFANMRVLANAESGETRPAARPITVRHLVTHTCGFPGAPTGKILEAYTRLGLRAGATAPSDAMPAPQSLEEWTNRIAQAPLAADPGAKWMYASALDVVGRLVEVISGMPFDAFLEQRMFAPLGMRSTAFWVPDSKKDRLITMYGRQDEALVARDRGPTSSLLQPPRIPRGSGGLVSTAHDYDRFMMMVINQGTVDGTTVIAADAVRLGTSDILPPGTDMSEYSSPTGYDGFGAGGLVTTGGERAGTYGWGGASGTTGFMNPRLGSRFGTFTNIGASDFGRRAMAAANMAFSAPTPGGSEVPVRRPAGN